MRRPKTIFKRDEAAGRVRRAETDEAFVPRPPRIQAARVAGPTEPPEDPTPWRGILRGEKAVSQVTPFVMVDLDLAPAFPLPEKGRAAVEAPEASEADPADEPAPVTHQQLQAEWQARLEEAVEQARTDAYAAGYEQGYVAAEAALQSSFDQRKGELEKDIARLQDAWKAFLEQSEPLMASLAFDVVAQLLDAPLPQEVRAVSAQALAQALEQFGEGIPLDVTLHPDDYARLQAYGFIDDVEASHSSIRWVSDTSIMIGDWVIQSPDAAIRRMKEEMLNHLKSRLGLLAMGKSRDA